MSLTHPNSAPISGELHTKLNSETAKIPWSDLQIFFAAGKVLYVNPQLDLLNIGCQIAEDRADNIEQLISNQCLKPVQDAQAKQWIKEKTILWALVIRPWVLVQETQ